VPPPFTLEVEAANRDGFKTAIGHLEQTAHPLATLWIVLSPLGAQGNWGFSHVCAFEKEPSIPDDPNKVAALGELIKSAEITGFARISDNPDLP
jgi:hypothetical protein